MFIPKGQTLLNSNKKKYQAGIPATVRCAHCRRSVRIFVDSRKRERKCLVLIGCCRDCNGPVTRLIEPED